MSYLNRRLAIQSLGMSALAASLGQIGGALGNEITESADLTKWIDKLYANAVKLKTREVSALRWQETMDRLYAAVELGALKERLDFGHLQQEILDKFPPGRGEMFHQVKLPGSADAKPVNGKQPHRYLQTMLLHVEKGRSVPPHGHSNMVSAFLCLSGEFDVRLYDRLEEQQNHMIIRQTADDKSAGPGTWSSISDYRDNVHWLTAKTDDCFLFSSRLMNLEENRPYKARVNIDVRRAELLGKNTLKAPKISGKESAELY